MDFRGSGQRAWAQLTGKAACAPAGDPARRVAIVLDNEIISSPQVDPQVACNVGIAGGSTQITGQFTAAEARDLALLIRGGALPVPVEIIEQRTVGPTLGQAAIEASAKAAVIGVILTGLFILARVPAAGRDRHRRAGRVRAHLLRGPARPRRHPDPARPRRFRARDRHGRGRQRAGVRAGPGGVRGEQAAGAFAPHCRPASATRSARSPTRTSPPCSPPGCCSSSRPGRSAGSVSRCRSACSPPWSAPWSSPACLPSGRSTGGRCGAARRSAG